MIADMQSGGSNEWLENKLKLNWIAGVLAAAIIMAMELVAIWTASPGQQMASCVVLCLAGTAVLLELWWRRRYEGSTRSPSGLGQKQRHFIRMKWPAVGAGDPIDRLLQRLKAPIPQPSITTHIIVYPTLRLSAESAILFLICANSGMSASPYMSIFICHSTLASLVIDRATNRALFGTVFVSLLGVLFWMSRAHLQLPLFAWGPVEFPALLQPVETSAWGFKMVVSTLAATLITGIIVQYLSEEVGKGQSQPGALAEHVLNAWAEDGRIYTWNCIDSAGAYQIDIVPSTPDGRDTLLLIPDCLRGQKCIVVEEKGVEDVVSVCRSLDCRNAAHCDAKFLIDKAEQRGIAWAIVGHGHGISSALQDYLKTRGRSPATVFGVSCVNAFAEHATRLLDARTKGLLPGQLSRLVFLTLKDGVTRCRSRLGLDQINARKRIVTTLDRAAFLSAFNRVT